MSLEMAGFWAGTFKMEILDSFPKVPNLNPVHTVPTLTS